MFNKHRSIVVCLLSLLLAQAAARAEALDARAAQPIRGDEAEKWIRWVIPRPHEIRLTEKVTVPGSEVAICLGPKAAPLECEAAEELAAALRQKTGRQVSVSKHARPKAAVAIVLGVCDQQGRLAGRPAPGAQRLATLPCAEQAYRIAALDGRTLALIGTRPQGVYYAAKTLKQLLLAPQCGREGQDAVSIPMADVTDWPDLAERGLWGGGGDGDADQDIEWLADRKMNLIETHAVLSIGPDGRGLATLSKPQLARAHRHAVKLVPIIHHLEQLPREVFARWPVVRAVGDEKAWRKVGNVYPACFSQPKTQELLADWMKCLAAYPEVTDVNVWLAENDVPCLCEKCKAANTFLLQTRAAVGAWQVARRTRPDLGLRILLTQGSFRFNAQILDAVPPEVQVIYYDGSRTYSASRGPMIYPLLQDYAARGRWLGCYPQLMASWRVVCPWSAPQFVKAMMTEFVSKRLRCLCAYTAPSDRFYEFNITAAAEWTWNNRGRGEREFSLAWATRQGLSDPEKAADWAVTLGPVGWDVYGARVPFYWLYGGPARMIGPGKRIALGKGTFVYFPDRKRFDQDLAACDRAMRLAREVAAPALIEETRVIRGLVEMLKGAYLLAEATTAGKRMTPQDRQQAAAALALADHGSRDAHDGLLAWAAAVAPRLVSPSPPMNLTDAADCVDRVMTEMSDAAASLGVADPGRAYRMRRIGTWTTDELTASPTLRKTWEVTRAITEAGRYQVSFYQRSRFSVRIQRVALVSTPAGDPAEQVQVSHDAHEGFLGGGQPRNATYELSLGQHDPQRRYFIVAELLAKPSPTRSSATGYVSMKKTAPKDK